mgnify:CR=1 FL=1
MQIHPVWCHDHTRPTEMPEFFVWDDSGFVASGLVSLVGWYRSDGGSPNDSLILPVSGAIWWLPTDFCQLLKLLWWFKKVPSLRDSPSLAWGLFYHTAVATRLKRPCQTNEWQYVEYKWPLPGVWVVQNLERIAVDSFFPDSQKLWLATERPKIFRKYTVKGFIKNKQFCTSWCAKI